jgi:glycosyltransferase involved in cell wall biosynthesis
MNAVLDDQQYMTHTNIGENRRLKVVHVTTAHPTFDVRIFHKECRTLAQSGYEVVLVAPHERNEMVHGVSIRAIPKTGGRFSRMTRCVWHAYREAISQNADIYHFHDPELIPAGLLLRARGKQVIYDVHEDLPRAIQSKFYLPVWVRRPLAWVTECGENAAARCLTALIAATPTIGNRLSRQNPNTIVVNNFPVLEEITADSQNWDERELCIAYIGSMSEQRGIRELVSAMVLVIPNLPVKLLLAGPFFPDGLIQELSQLPGWKNVEWLGVLGRQQVTNLLGRVRAGVVLFHPEPNHVNSQPTKLYEYMAAGIPVVASDFPLWREIVGDAGCGLLVDPRDPNAIAKAITYLLTHSEESQEMGRRGRIAVEERYSWKNEQASLIRLYGSLLKDTVRAGIQHSHAL